MKYGLQNGNKWQNERTHSVLILLLISVIAICCAIFLWKAGEYVYDWLTRSSKYDMLIEAAAVRNHIDPSLVKAVIWQESRFDFTARGLKGEVGLMQIMPEYAATDWARAHQKIRPYAGALFDPELNIEIGSWYLAKALRKYRKYKDAAALALCEYNAGVSRVNDWKPADPGEPVIDRITIPSTKKYVQAILQRYQYYKRQKTEQQLKGSR